MKIKFNSYSPFIDEYKKIRETFTKYIVEKLKERTKKGVFLKVLTGEFGDYNVIEVDETTFPEQFKMLKDIRSLNVSIDYQKKVSMRVNESGYRTLEDVLCSLFEEKFRYKEYETDEFVKEVYEYAETLIRFFVSLDEEIERRRNELWKNFENSEMYKYVRKKEFEKKLEV